jgi:hypothetical protein
MVKTGKLENRDYSRSKGKALVGLNKQNKLAQTDRKHRYKYLGDIGEDGQHLEQGEDKHKDR